MDLHAGVLEIYQVSKPRYRQNMNPENKFYRFLQLFTFLMTVIAAVASLRIMYSVGSNQKSILLIVLFTGWVLSAFIAMLVVNLVSGRLNDKQQLLAHVLIIILNLGSVAAYNGMFSTPEMKPAAVFLIFPLISWMIIGIGFLVIRRQLQEK